MEQRQYPRFPYKEPVGWNTSEDWPSAGSLSGDISAGGVRIRVQQFVALKTIVNLNIHLKNPLRVVPVKGIVAWVREVPESEAFDIGIRFLAEDRSMPVIQDYVGKRRFDA